MQQNDEETSPTGRRPTSIEWPQPHDCRPRFPSDEPFAGFPSLDFAEVEKRMLALMASGDKEAMTSLTVNEPGPTLTFEAMMELIEDASKKQQEEDDKFVMALLSAGFRVMINEDLPTGMVAVLPGNFKGSLRRAMEKLRGGDKRFGLLYNCIPAPDLNFQS